jgi:SAM-dependent methyltransferase
MQKIKMIGVDLSKISLEKAAKAAGSKFHDFVSENSDFCDMHLVETFGEKSVDIIVCVSTLNQDNWEMASKALDNVARLLKQGGTLYAIVPSFEAVDEWLNLWIKNYEREHGETQARRVKIAWEKNKQFDRNNHTYAEDGLTSECFFTKERIADLLSKYHGIDLKMMPSQMFYPWELISRFDYGFYKNTSFELYDWYVVGVKK